MRQDNQFSDNKIYFHAEKLTKILNDQIVSPVVYELSLSGFCNCKCEYCCCKNFHSAQMLSRKDIDLLVGQLKDSALAVTITGGGEPLTNPDFSYCVQQLGNNGLSVGVITNGLLLDENSAEAIVRHGSFVRISLDTVDEKEYKRLRGIELDAKRLSENLKFLADKKREFGSQILIGSQIVYIDQSIEDIENTIRFSKDTGIDFIQIRPVDNIPNVSLVRNYAFYKEHKKDLEVLTERYTDEHFKVILNENKFEEYYSGEVAKEYSKCLGANLTASIGHDMKLYICCTHIGNPMFCIGDLRKNSLRELLYSEKRRALIKSPCFAHCQIQCRNHKLNKLLKQLKALEAGERDMLMAEKSSGSVPVHYEFL